MIRVLLAHNLRRCNGDGQDMQQVLIHSNDHHVIQNEYHCLSLGPFAHSGMKPTGAIF